MIDAETRKDVSLSSFSVLIKTPTKPSEIATVQSVQINVSDELPNSNVSFNARIILF